MEDKRCAPLFARTHCFHRAVRPTAYDCVKLVTVRDGSALVFSEFGARHARSGDVILVSANAQYGAQPEGHFRVTVVDIDLDFVLDQFFWQNFDLVQDRSASQSVAETIYTEPRSTMSGAVRGRAVK